MPRRVFAVRFLYSIKTRRRFNSHAKCIVRVSTRFTLLLFAVRTSKEVTMITSNHNLILLYKQTRPALAKFFTCLPLEKTRDISLIPSNLLQPIKSTTQVYVESHHQYGRYFGARSSEVISRGKPAVTSRNDCSSFIRLYSENILKLTCVLIISSVSFSDSSSSSF